MILPFKGGKGPIVVALSLILGACAPKAATPPDYSLFIELCPCQPLSIPHKGC